MAGIVGTAISASFVIGRLGGLPIRMMLLVACGNLAIAALTPVIEADADDVGAAITFTAVLGVIVVLGPAPVRARHWYERSSLGAFAALTVYAVPQAILLGTLVELVRVLMLGPGCLVLSLAKATRCGPGSSSVSCCWSRRDCRRLFRAPSSSQTRIWRRAYGRVDGALGLMPDLRAVVEAGERATLAVCLSLVVLVALNLTILVALGIG